MSALTEKIVSVLIIRALLLSFIGTLWSGHAVDYEILECITMLPYFLQDPHVDCYSISSIEETLGCNRECLIGLAILLGCDYLPKVTVEIKALVPASNFPL